MGVNSMVSEEVPLESAFKNRFNVETTGFQYKILSLVLLGPTQERVKIVGSGKQYPKRKPLRGALCIIDEEIIDWLIFESLYMR